jgi:ATP diphosphatase
MGDLKRVMERLRDPEGGCPWDQKQSFETIITYTLEECYELAEAIDQADLKQIAEELGDVLFQVVFYSQLGSELGAFDLDTVIDGLVRKLVRRHPHVFVGEDLESRPEHEDLSVDVIKDTWERLKQEEREQKNAPGLLDDVPYALPALSRAQKLQKRAARIGFDWTSQEQVLGNLNDELTELQEAMISEQSADIEEEAGDLLFSVVNLTRHLGLDAESTLRAANKKFERRFRHMEHAARVEGKKLQDETPEQLELRWQSAKRQAAD